MCHGKTVLFLLFVNNKGADQPAYPRSVIRAVFVRCIERMAAIHSIFRMFRLLTGLCN